MRCISKRIAAVLLMIVMSLPLAGFAKREKSYEDIVYGYEQEKYNTSISQSSFSLAQDLCVTSGDINEINYTLTDNISGGALFDIDNKQVLYGHNLFERVYPASITKIMTALLLIENCNLDDTITIPAEACDFPTYASLCGLQAGDTIKLGDLLYGLLLPSGNDAAAAIAIHIAGSISGFADMMNQKAAELMATGTHFVNPHGLDDDEHYTTPYDLYLIFNECIKHDEFVQAISTKDYECDVVHADGTSGSLSLANTNQFISGEQNAPEYIVIDGGKTGTTANAGNCLIVLAHNETTNNKYISMILGASSKPQVYSNMTGFFDSIPPQ